MKIGITQRQILINNIPYDCLEQGWFRLFRQHEIIIIPNLVNLDLDIDMLVFSGGDTTEDRHLTELHCYQHALDTGIPVLGVCHGAFLLNLLYDGTNGTTQDHHNTAHLITMNNNEYTVNSYHRMCISELGEALVPLAWANNSVEAFRHLTRPHWGVVWHPERMDNPVIPKDLERLING